jgi:purine catabolism regulator
MATQPALSLADLLAHEELALELHTGDAQAPLRRVAGAHSIELEQPSSWLAPDWVMLTAGTRLRGSTDAQRSLVAELDAAGVSALGFGVELAFKRIPHALLDEADRRGFPVFTVPLRTPFREIVTAINRSLLSSELRAYQRLSSMQIYLVDALRDPEPRGAVVARLAELLDASVLLLGADGSPELTVGDAPVAAIWAAIGSRPVALHEVDAEGWHVVAAPVLGRDDEPRQWLVAAARPGSVLHPLAKPATQAAAPVLAATDRLELTERRQERAIRAAVLDDLLETAGSPHVLAARAAEFGLDFAVPARVLVMRGVPEDAAEAALGRSGATHMASQRDGTLTALVQGGEDELRAHLEALVDNHPGAVAGLGRSVATAEGVPESWRDASLALRSGGGTRLLAFEDFDLPLLLLSEAPPARVQPKVDEWTALLRARPMLWEAVMAYFDADLDVVRTAKALHLHPNSLRYRLSRVEKLLGRSLKQPATIAELYIALLATR